MQRGERHVRAGVGVVDRGCTCVALDEHLARVELPPEERVDQARDGEHLVAGRRGQEVVLDRVPVVHRQLGPELHHHRLRPDGQRADEHVVALDRLLQVHQPLARGVVGRVQFGAVADPRHAHPAAAVVRLHEQRVAQRLGHLVEVERLVVPGGGVGVAGVVDRVLVRHQHGLGHLQAQPDHRAVGGVLLHRLERERAVEQVHVVHQRDLLQPLARVVVPVRQPVDDQRVPGPVAQVERLDGDPAAGAAGGWCRRRR